MRIEIRLHGGGVKAGPAKEVERRAKLRKGWQTDKELIWHRAGERKTVGINQSFHPVEALRSSSPNDRLIFFYFLISLFFRARHSKSTIGIHIIPK